MKIKKIYHFIALEKVESIPFDRYYGVTENEFRKMKETCQKCSRKMETSRPSKPGLRASEKEATGNEKNKPRILLSSKYIIILSRSESIVSKLEFILCKEKLVYRVMNPDKWKGIGISECMKALENASIIVTAFEGLQSEEAIFAVSFTAMEAGISVVWVKFANANRHPQWTRTIISSIQENCFDLSDNSRKTETSNKISSRVKALLANIKPHQNQSMH